MTMEGIMGLDLYITGREIISGILAEEDTDDFPIHAIERNLSRWCGWEHNPLVDWFAENLSSSGHAGYPADGSYYFLDEEDIQAVIAAIKEEGLGLAKEEYLEDRRFNFRRLADGTETFETDLEDYTSEYIREFEKALAWLRQPRTDRKIYFEVWC
jgi:hypothetical protein